MQAGRRKVPQEEKGGRRDSHNRAWTTTHASRANCTRPTAATGYAAKLKRIASLNDDFKKKTEKKKIWELASAFPISIFPNLPPRLARWHNNTSFPAFGEWRNCVWV